MTKKLDGDVRALRGCVRALEFSTSERMLKANVEYLYDCYIRHPRRSSTPTRRASRD